MDDLDHSMHIAEYDWNSFCDESEDCVLLLPPLAHPDDWSLSEPEDSGLQETRGAAEELDLSDIRGHGDNKQVERRATDGSTRAEQTERQSQGEGAEESQLASTEQASLSGNQPESGEKERWFVTVNDNLTRRRVRPTSVKKKRRQKRPFEGVHTEEVIAGAVGQMDKKEPKHGTKPAKCQHDIIMSDSSITENLQNPPIMEGNSDTLGGDAESDSESYISASESAEEAQNILQDPPSLQPAPLTSDRPEISLSGDEADEDQGEAEMLCEASTGETLTVPQTQTPDFSSTPSSAADGPEKHAKAAGLARPIYAISSFWDEMERLTINDILQVRMRRHDPVEKNPAETVLLDPSDGTDSDYFTQSDESKPDRSSWEFSTSDFEEECCPPVSGSSSPNLLSKDQQRDSFLPDEDVSPNSEDGETPGPQDEPSGRNGDHLEGQTLTSGPRQMTRSRSLYSLEALNTHDFSLLCSLDEGADLETLSPLSHTHAVDTSFHTSCPELGECFLSELFTASMDSQHLTVYAPDETSVLDSCLWTSKRDASSSSALQHSTESIIPVFSCSGPSVRELTFPKHDCVFSRANCEEPQQIPLESYSCFQISSQLSSAAVDGSGFWKGLLSRRKLRLADKGSMWFRGSRSWMCPFDTDEFKLWDESPLSVEKVHSTSGQICRELEERRTVLAARWVPTEHVGIFSRVKQSDMCLVCIAFASWVLRSSDPEAADAWKAALLANVSALSAIQYLRQYMRRMSECNDL